MFFSPEGEFEVWPGEQHKGGTSGSEKRSQRNLGGMLRSGPELRGSWVLKQDVLGMSFGPCTWDL